MDNPIFGLHVSSLQTWQYLFLNGSVVFVERLRTLPNSDKSIEIDFALLVMRSYNQVPKSRNKLETNNAVTNIYMFLTLFHSDIVIGNIILPVIRLLSCKAQGHNDLSKPSKPCHVGIHWKALMGDYSIRKKGGDGQAWQTVGQAIRRTTHRLGHTH